MSDSATPWTAAHQTSLSFTISWTLLKLMPIEQQVPTHGLHVVQQAVLPVQDVQEVLAGLKISCVNFPLKRIFQIGE